MNKDLNNTVVRVESETQKNAIIALANIAELEVAMCNLNNKDMIILHDGGFEISHQVTEITLDQLAWGYGLAEDKHTHLVMCGDDEGTLEFCVNAEIDGDGCIDSDIKWYGSDYKIISTRPKQTLQNGDYLPKELITSADEYELVIQAAENCGFNVMGWREEIWETLEGDPVIDSEYGLVMTETDKNKIEELDLEEWLECGGVKREEVKTVKVKPNDDGGFTALEDFFTPEVGESCIINNCGNTHTAKKILFLGSHYCIALMDWGEQHYHLSSIKFKPLPTPEEVEREEFVKEFKKDFVGFGNFILKNKDMNPDDHMPAFFYELGYRKTK